MPSQRPRASFEPLPPDLDLNALVEETPHFQYVDRISCDMIDQQGFADFEKLVLLHVVIGGKPLVIDGYQGRLDPWTFSPKWLQDNHGEKVENARDLTKKTILPLTIGHYVRSMGKLTDQFFDKPENYKDTKDRQRIYLKDIDCPPVWYDKLKEQLPASLFYLNEGTGDIGGAGSTDEPAPTGGRRRGRGIAPAGDLMSSLPAAMRAENLMCYIGHEGTFTPSHREMCASLGHNIMVEASDLIGDDGKPEKSGSSIWFMTESKDRKTVAEYWLSILGHDIETENHFAQIAAWKRAPFSVYVVEQRPGDFILIPPLAPHQVWNRGTRTMKVAWNRTTVETLTLAMNEALPNARMVCRDEQYKNKAIIYFTLQKYSALLARLQDQLQTAPSPQEAAMLRQGPKIRQLQKDFKRLFVLFREILLSEMYSPENPERNVQFLPYEGYVTCAYCRGNIFNRFLSCQNCEFALGTTEAEPYDVCMECYAMGRSCGCISKLKWVEQFKWKELTQRYEQWRKQYVAIDGGQKSSTPLPLTDERQRMTKKTLTQVCQEQLKKRPWVDINKRVDHSDKEDEDSGDDIQYNADGTVRQKKKKRSEAWLKNHRACHVCCHRHETWKMFGCKCGRWWCYGTLFRGFDTMPQTIMEDPNWECPHCRGVCIAGNCRKDTRQKPYEPKGTLLGHDTKKIADVRSTESLVDFSVSNLTFLREKVDAPTSTARLDRRAAEADRDKQADPTLDEHYASDEDRVNAVTTNGDGFNQIEYDMGDTSIIDPQLGDGIDPALGGNGGQASRGFTAVNGSVPSALPSLAAVANHNRQESGAARGVGTYDGYQPASQPDFVAPQAVMFQVPQADEDENDSDSLYPSLDRTESHSLTGRGGKRKVVDGTSDEIIRLPSKKKRKKDEEPASEATKQFRKQQERRAKEEARKSGRYVQFIAALRGYSKVVKLSIGREAALQVLAKDAARKQASRAIRTTPATPHGAGIAASGTARVGEGAEGHGSSSNVLVRSDVLPLESEVSAMPGAATPNKKGGAGASKNVRVRVERDEDFGARKRNRGSTAKVGGDGGTSASSGRRKRKSSQYFEELDIGSDPEDLEEDDEDGGIGGAVEITEDGGRRRRISTWQARRHADEDQEADLESLPDDWRDGSRRQSQEAQTTPQESRRNVAGKAPRMSASIRPSGSSSKPTRGQNLDGDAEDEERYDSDGTDANTAEDNEDDDEVVLRQEANRQGKTAGASDRNKSTNGKGGTVSVAPSIMSRSRGGPGGGRKVKIVSGSAAMRSPPASSSSAAASLMKRVASAAFGRLAGYDASVAADSDDNEDDEGSDD